MSEAGLGVNSQSSISRFIKKEDLLSLFFGHIDCQLVFFSVDISIWCRQSPHYDTDIIGLTE